MSRNTIARKLLSLLGVGVLSASLVACSASAESGADTITEGKLTIGTGEPAYFPYVIDDDPTSAQGFESALAYAIAEELGFAPEDVIWVRTTFEAAIQPGPKDFDFNLQQYTITEERAQNVDFSDPYYSTPQAIITVGSSPAASATSIADLKGLLIGAASGSTSFLAIEGTIAPTQGAQAFNNNDDAKLALETGQIDALVVDLPTAFYLAAVEITDGVLVGQLPATAGVSDEWGFVLPKNSPLTAAINRALKSLRDSGKLQEITDTWLGSDQGAPLLK
jgi:polar amino acid transport system substrate-binding protein